jgi:uncharacterized protein (PEP-CTERM system associated)
MVGLASGQGLVISPTLSVTETRTNNRDLAYADRQSDFITQISPGVSMTAGRGPLKGSLSYSLSGLIYAEKPSLNTVYHSLSSLASLSLLDGRAGIDATASASRQMVSAFGTQSIDPALNNSNQAQVFSYSLSPYLSGQLLGGVNYQGRVQYAGSRSDAAASNGDAASLVASAGLSGRLGVLGWSVDASRSIYENADRPRGHNGAVGTTWTYQPDPEVQLQGRVGTEVDDIRTGQSERTNTWGAGLTWRPGPRSTGRLEFDHRYFGRSHLVSISHRMANTIWSYSDSRNLETGGSTGRNVVSNYDKYFALNPSIEDPVQRDIFVRNELARLGLDPAGQAVVGGFLTGGPAVQRSQVASVAYQGLRATLSISYVQTSSQSVSNNLSTGDDLANGVQPRQKGLSLAVSHRLTPDSSVLVSLGQQRTAASGIQPANDLRTISATWSATLGPHTNVSVGARYSSFDSDTNPYQESAVFGSIRLRF